MGTHRVSIIQKKMSATVTGCPENPFISLGETPQTTTFGKHHKRPLLGKHHKRPVSTRFLNMLKQDNDFGTIQEWLDREILLKLVLCGVSPKVVVCGVSQ